MASYKTFLEMSIFITLLAQQNTEATKRESSNLLSLLTNRLHHYKQPLIIVLGKNTAVKNRARVDTALSSESSDEAVYLVHHLLGHDQNKAVLQPHVQHKKSTKKPYQRDQQKRQRFRFQGLREDGRVQQKEDKTVLRSPIVKKLLRISNSLRCAARNECQHKCNNKFHGVLEIKCQFQCEAKYDCDKGMNGEKSKEAIKEESDCEDGKDYSGSCNGSDDMSGGEMEEMSSTRGVKVEFGQLRS